MVEVFVTASVQVTGGPTLPLGSTLDPESYTYASVDLAVAEKDQLELLPQAGTVVLLAMLVTSHGGSAGLPPTVSVTPVGGGGEEGGPLDIKGSLLISNAAVLSGLTTGGSSRTLKLENTSSVPVTVTVLACREP